MLKIENLTKAYGDKRAVDNLSLHIKAGEMYAFIGHNGAGKTTTIKACTGLLNFDGGEIYIDGVSIKENPLSQPGLSAENGYIGIASDLITYDKEYADIISSLVGKTVIVDNIDNRLLLS